jgi:hypothetical protein
VRADGMDVGHVDELPRGIGGTEEQDGVADDGTVIGKRHGGILSGPGQCERCTPVEHGRDRVCKCDASRGERGSCWVQSGGENGTHRVRADWVVLRHICAVPGWTQHDGQ